ncbi:hypothetical protein HK102_002583, partial [Quaeritorhiza haematococci]
AAAREIQNIIDQLGIVVSTLALNPVIQRQLITKSNDLTSNPDVNAMILTSVMKVSNLGANMFCTSRENISGLVDPNTDWYNVTLLTVAQVEGTPQYALLWVDYKNGPSLMGSIASFDGKSWMIVGGFPYLPTALKLKNATATDFTLVHQRSKTKDLECYLSRQETLGIRQIECYMNFWAESDPKYPASMFPGSMMEYPSGSCSFVLVPNRGFKNVLDKLQSHHDLRERLSSVSNFPWFFGDIDRANKDAIIVVVVVTLGVVLIIGGVMWWIVTPLSILAQAMKRLTVFGFAALQEGKLLDVRSFVAEISYIQETFGTMVRAFAGGIRTNKLLVNPTTRDDANPEKGVKYAISGSSEGRGI